jgi:hypothetical protein
MVVRQRRKPGLALAAAPEAEPEPAPAPAELRRPSPPPPLPAAPEPPLPSGLVTTRLRSAPPTQAQAPAPTPAPPVGAVVSTGLRPWIDLDVALEEVLLSETEARLRFRLTLLNKGMAAAREIRVEALALNAGDDQAAEIATFYARPDGNDVSVPQLQRLGVTELVHEVRMPRGAIREYEVQGRRLFVPILAFNAAYRWTSGAGRSSAAFLVGHEGAGAERLAPLRLDHATSRLTRLGVRRLDDAVRR